MGPACATIGRPLSHLLPSHRATPVKYSPSRGSQQYKILYQPSCPVLSPHCHLLASSIDSSTLTLQRKDRSRVFACNFGGKFQCRIPSNFSILPLPTPILFRWVAKCCIEKLIKCCLFFLHGGVISVMPVRTTLRQDHITCYQV